MIFSRYLLKIQCLLAIALLPTAVWAETLSATLPNGLQVIVKEDARAPAVVTQLWYRVGSQDEQVGKTGLSHALEHMMFKGTKAVPSGEFSRRIAAWGGNDNAYTNREVTVYHQSVAAKHLPDVLAMEADRMSNLNFSDADFVNEMQVIKEERRMRTEDSPMGKLWEKTNETVFKQANNRAPVVGYEKDLNALKPDDLRNWYRTWYAPNNATLVIVGDVSAKSTINTVKQLFGRLPEKTLPTRAAHAEPAAQWGERAETSAPSELPIINIVYSAPRWQTLDDKLPYALSVLNDVLSSYTSARLPKNLERTQQLAVSAGSNYDLLTRTDNLFTLSAYPAKGVSIAKLQQALQQQIADIAHKGISEQELKRVRTQTQASRIYAKDSMFTEADMIGELTNVGLRWQDEDAVQQRLLAVSPQDVQAAAQFLMAQKPAVITLKPLPTNKTTPLETLGDHHATH